MIPPDSNSPHDALVGRVVDEYFEALETGSRPKLDELVKRYPEIADILKTVIPAMQVSTPSEPSLASEQRVLGDFRILRQIGRGGMGVVYQAEQISMKRQVALKVLPLAGLLDEPKIQRFRSEVRAVASLDHPNIVSVYSVGEQRGTHFFAMQLIRGNSLSEVIEALRNIRGDDAKPDPQDNPIVSAILTGSHTSTPEVAATEDFDSKAAPEKRSVETMVSSNSSTIRNRSRREYFRSIVPLFVQAADALEHAHGRGIVHRDIKPANLLLDAQSQLYVTDFGLAQIETEAGLTMTGDLLGTLRYMAPEQTLAKRVAIDHRADVYSLGATLYELLGLQPAFPSNDRHELLKQVAFDEPKSLRRIDASIPSELETIVQKAMAKNRDERYETVQDFGDDLTRFLEHRPILAKRPNLAQLISKWISRNPTIALTSLAVLTILATVFGISNTLITKQRNQAKIQFQVANVVRMAAESRALLNERPSLAVLLAIRARNLSNRHQIAKIVADEALLNASQTLPNSITLQDNSVSQLIMSDRWIVTLVSGRIHLRNLESPAGAPLVLGDDDRVRSLSLSRDRRWLVALGNHVQRWDLDSPSSTTTIPIHTQAKSADMSANGEILAVLDENKQVSVWNCSTPQPQLLRRLATYEVRLLSVSPDGRFLITAAPDDPIVLQWDLEKPAAKPRSLDGHTGRIVGIEHHEDGRTFATLDRNKLLFWKTDQQGLAARAIDYHGAYASDRILSPDFTKLFLRQSYTSRLHAIDLSADDPLTAKADLKGHSIDISHLQVCDDGRSLFSAARDGSVRIWDIRNWPPKTKRIFKAHDAVDAVTVHPDGRWMATLGMDQTVRLWDRSRPESSEPRFALNSLDDFSFSTTVTSHTGRWIATTVQESRLQLWDVEAEDGPTFCRVLDNPESAFSQLAISGNDRWFVASCHNGAIQIWDLHAQDLESSRRILPAPSDIELGEGDGGARLAVGPTARWVAVSYGAHIRLWDLAARQPRVTNLKGHKLEVVSVQFSLDGRWLATGARDSVRLWDLAESTDAPQGILLREEPSTWSMEFDNDSRYLFSATSRNVYRWDLHDLTVAPLTIEPSNDRSGGIWEMAVNGDGSKLVTTRFTGDAQLWDLTGALPVAHEIPTHIGIQCVAFSPDNRWLATGGPSNARLWDLTAVDPIETARVLRGHAENIWSVAFSGDSKWLVTDASDAKIRRWCLDTDYLIDQSKQLIGRELTAEESLQFSLDPTSE